MNRKRTQNEGNGDVFGPDFTLAYAMNERLHIHQNNETCTLKLLSL